MDLSKLFSDLIVYTHHFQDLHPGQASDVWLVETTKERLIVRTTRMPKEPSDEFWWGCQALFGIDPTDVFAMETVNNLLSKYSTIPVPKVVRKDLVGSVPFVFVEVLNGSTVRKFADLPDEAIYELGRAIAHIHRCERPTCGNIQGTKSYPAKEFPRMLANVLPRLVEKFHADNRELLSELPRILNLIEHIPTPAVAVPILLDMDPTQFLSDGNHITGLIDTEVYAFGPCELDLIALEYLLDVSQAEMFYRGYSSTRNFPDLTLVREVYRYLNLALNVQGAVPVQKWLSHPKLFAR